MLHIGVGIVLMYKPSAVNMEIIMIKYCGYKVIAHVADDGSLERKERCAGSCTSQHFQAI